MKVLMLGRSDLFSSGGGDKVQIDNTADELRKLGIDVDIDVSSAKTDFSKYDIVHVFQLDWVLDTYFHINNAKRVGKPVVFSPIHHSVKEVKKFDDEYVFDLRRVSRYIFRDQFKRDTLKNLYRALFDSKLIKPFLFSVVKGFKNMHIEMLKMSDIVLVQTELEARDLMDTYKVDFKWVKVPNGVGNVFLDKVDFEKPFNFKDYIICVGRIEAIKNQLKIINAVKKLRDDKNLDVKLVFIGKKSTKKHFEYVHKFNVELQKYPWIIYIEQVPYEQIPSYFHFAKVGISASWFETTGLTSLDALFVGTNAVACGDRAKEYLDGYASYCRPDEDDSIYEALLKEYYAERPKLPSDIINTYTWKNAAAKTLEVYKSIR